MVPSLGCSKIKHAPRRAGEEGCGGRSAANPGMEGIMRGLLENTITRDLTESNKSMDEGNHERLSGGSGKHLRGCHNPTARTK